MQSLPGGTRKLSSIAEHAAEETIVSVV